MSQPPQLPCLPLGRGGGGGTVHRVRCTEAHHLSCLPVTLSVSLSATWSFRCGLVDRYVRTVWVASTEVEHQAGLRGTLRLE